MRIVLISDIHANLPALEAVLEDIDGHPAAGGGAPVPRPADSDTDREIDAIYHLGDLVGYAPWPDEVVALIRRRGLVGVAGNYDSTVATDHEHCGCRYEDPRQEELSHLSYQWTRQHCGARTKQFLGALPFRLDIRPFGGHASGPKIVLVHGAPTLNTLYWTEDRDDEFCRKMAARAGVGEGDLIAFGHTHKPWHREVDGVQFVNTGSVGRPKDGDWRAGYVVLEIGGGKLANDGDRSAEAGFEVSFERVEYDLEAATNGIRDSALPDEFAYYLESGGKSLGPEDR